MRVAVSGANGFIGKYVISSLLQKGYEIIALSRKPVNDRLEGKVQNIIAELYDTPALTYQAIQSPDIFIHLAWGGLPNYKSLHHLEFELPNQFRFISNLVKTGLKNLVISGTCFEYGMQSGCLSEDLPKQPNNCYGLAKEQLRNQLTMMSLELPFNLTWARLFYPYGKGQSKKSLLSQLATAVKENKPVFNMSGGEQLRDFLPVEVLADYIAQLALQCKNHGEVNICSGNPISVRRFVEEQINLNNWEIDLNLGYYPYPDYEPLAFWGDADKLNRLLKLDAGHR